ncbi:MULTISPECIES: FkbM family methyltransferase [Pectobacterium]|uniref:FkbM family methyltransferase n=1 Tax=Pectobacterium TaxID=122277 RepID=UPI0006914473|nr:MULTISPECIES: FkbM family methyltransferase [Pectobacterium]MBA0191909.1 FkbM family methyltransferase [Pectobacterium carotovorum]MBA0199335.1 FkbM family methyltransferase [Pectobacterium carotovorum]MCA6973803.1 FkbM family methyltransferase [Pectobacterium carotovorum]
MKKSSEKAVVNKKKNADSATNQKIKLAAEWLSTQPGNALQLVTELLQRDEKNPLLLVIAGRAQQKLGNFFEAEQLINEALKHYPSYLEAIYAKADLLYRRERLEEAEIYLFDAIRMVAKYESRPLRSLQATVLQKLKKYEQAEEIFNELIQEDPSNWMYWSNLGMIKQDLGYFDEMDAIYQKGEITTKSNPAPFFNRIVGSHYHPERTAEQILALCKAWQPKFKFDKKSRRAVAKNKTLNKMLRIGMISDGFRSHPVGNMVTIGLSHIPESQIEFYAYSTNYSEDHITQKIKEICTQWKVIADISNDSLAKIIREDEVDILFDLCGYNANSRMLTLLQGPAPIQIKWVGGLISSTGLETMDYLLSDPVETPAGVDALYTEKLIRLPDDYICYDPPHYLPPISELPVASKGYVTFGCFNNASKINDILLSQWAIILNSVPNSQLFLKSFNYTNQALSERIYATLEKHGISRERVRIEGGSPHRELLASYNDVDIALDPWPYSGGLTTCEAMAMGVPVVTLPGPTFAGRHSASHLVNAGMPELVANDWEQYINITVGIANDVDSLSVIRQHLRDILLSSPVCDGKRFAKNFSDAMRAIWQRYCEGKAPEALTLSNDFLPYFHDDNQPVILQHPASDSVVSTKQQDGFSFQLSGKIIAMDHGGSLATNKNFINLTATNAFHFIIMDMLGEVEERHLPLRKKGIQHIKLHGLGDGESSPVYMCLAPEYSSDLKPISGGMDAVAAISDNKVLAEIMVKTSRLDQIHGLDHLEWLSLDNRYNIKRAIAHGDRILSKCLVVQVKTTFSSTHQEQLLFDDITALLIRYGFVFHSFKNIEYAPSIEISEGKMLASSKMLSAIAIYVPDENRLQSMEAQSREKLAFILHTVYHIHDLTYYILALNSLERANIYISEAENLNFLVEKSNKHSLPQKLIVSLTSYYKRFKTLHLTLDCLIKQSVKPDRLVLWIAESERSLVPNNVLAFRDHGVEIKYCEDIKSYKKIVPTLIEDPNAFIVTADDDLCYKPDWLEKLINAWDGNYKTVVAWRAHKIVLDKHKYPIPYREWVWGDKNISSEKSTLLFPTSGAGTLYPPHCFYRDIINKNIFGRLCVNTDDVWLYWMCRLSGSSFKVVGEQMDLLEWKDNSDNESLWHDNILKGKNDNNIKNMISYYGFIDDEPSLSPCNILNMNNLFSFSHVNNMVCMYLPNELDHIQRVIKTSHNFYESEMLADIAEKTKNGSTIIDIGANIGNHSVYFGLFCCAGKVLSFEPQKEVYNTLSKNIYLNSLSDKVTAFEMGLGSYEATAKLGNVDEKNIGMTKLEINDKGGIKISTLDSIIENEMPENISVIKIDVEGMEMEVLRGAIKTLAKYSPAIYAEAATKPEFDSINNFLLSFGYVSTKRFNATATYLFEKM